MGISCKYCCGRNCQQSLNELNYFNPPKINKNIFSIDDFFKLIPEEIYNKMQKEKFPAHKNQAYLKIEKILVDNNSNSEYEDNKKEIFYHGEYNEQNQRDGVGKMIIQNNKEKIFYHGIWHNDNLNEGYIYYEDGSVYKGDIKDYMRDGKGKYITNNYKYDGDWKEDQKGGDGSLTFKDGTKYIGEFKKDKFNGKGKMEWKDGYYYDGNFMNSFFHGKGYLRMNNGHIYNGNFQYGAFHGEGEFKWINGMSLEFYKGNYSYGKKDGKGEFHFENGNIYKGEWKSGNPDGEGIFETNNRKYFGNWRAGMFMQLIEVEDKEEAKEENLNLTFKVPTEDLFNLDHISTSVNTSISVRSSEAEMSIEYIKND